MSQVYIFPPVVATSSTSGTPGLPVPGQADFIAGKGPTGLLTPVSVDASGNINVNLVGVFPSPMQTQDQADGPVAPGAVASKSILIGVQFNTVLPTLANGQQSAAQADSSGRLLITAQSLPLPAGASTSANQAAGNASLASIDGKIVHVDTGNVTVVSSALPSNAAQEAGGHLASIDSKLTNPLPVSGTFFQATQPVSAVSLPLPANAAQETGGHLASIDSKLTSPLAVTGTFFQANQTVSGTVTANQGTANATPWNENIAQFGGSVVSLGQKVSASSIPVVIASDQSALPVTGVFFQATQPVSGTVNAKAATPTPLTITQAAITVGITAVRLTVSGAAPASTRVALGVTPDLASTAKFYIGGSTVTNSGTTRGIEIAAGQSFVANNDAGDYFIVSDTAGQTVEIMEQA